MAVTSQTVIAAGRLGKAGGFAVKLAPLWGVFGRAFETEVSLCRPFLWLPVAAGAEQEAVRNILAAVRRQILLPQACCPIEPREDRPNQVIFGLALVWRLRRREAIENLLEVARKRI